MTDYDANAGTDKLMLRYEQETFDNDLWGGVPFLYSMQIDLFGL